MHIVIDYDSCWQASFIDGDPNKPVGKDNKRTFLATTKSNGQKDAAIQKDTIIGVLNRLIGDQRKLYQARKSDNYFFSKIEKYVDFSIKESDCVTTQETIYLTNKSDDRSAQSTFLGAIDYKNPWFYSFASPLLWSVLFLDKNDLLCFIISDVANDCNQIDCTPRSLLARIDLLVDRKSEMSEPWLLKETLISKKQISISKAKEKLDLCHAKLAESNNISAKKQASMKKKQLEAQENLDRERLEIEGLLHDKNLSELDSLLKKAVAKLKEKYPECEYIENGGIKPIRLYSAALYLQAERLAMSGVDIEFAKGKNNEIHITGFSKRGFNGLRDWLGRMTGNRKKAVGTPCLVQKQSGKLEIILNINMDRAIELKNMIDNAGVSSFYLGKKGLAYVSHIDVR